jgi:redox-regulated HSP33 family molecular chaperone
MEEPTSAKSSEEATAIEEEGVTPEVSIPVLLQRLEALEQERQHLTEELARTQTQLATALLRAEAATRVVERLLKDRKVTELEQQCIKGQSPGEI